MPDGTRESSEPGHADPPPGRPDRPRRQVGLRTQILLMAAIAVWMTYFIDRRRIAWLEGRIAATRPMAHELAVDDPGRLAVVKLEELWYDENRWYLYLPDGSYRLCLATRGVVQDGLAPILEVGTMGPGRHHVELEQRRVGDGWRVEATWDGSGRLAVDEPKGWYPGSGSTGGGEFSVSTQRAADQPLVLFRRRFTKPAGGGQFSSPQGPTEGVLLWVERVTGSDLEARKPEAP